MANREKIAYTDGGSNDEYQGGWAFYVPGELKCCGYVDNTTNNEMELRAMIELLKYIGYDRAITIYSDSTYVVKGLTEWSIGWRKHNWIKADGNLVANPELWKELVNLYNPEKHNLQFVKGHAGVEGNEVCDELVQQAKLSKLARYEVSELGTVMSTETKLPKSNKQVEVIEDFENAIGAFNSLDEYDKRIIAARLVSLLAPVNYVLGKY